SWRNRKFLTKPRERAFDFVGVIKPGLTQDCRWRQTTALRPDSGVIARKFISVQKPWLSDMGFGAGLNLESAFRNSILRAATRLRPALASFLSRIRIRLRRSRSTS